MLDVYGDLAYTAVELYGRHAPARSPDGDDWATLVLSVHDDVRECACTRDAVWLCKLVSIM